MAGEFKIAKELVQQAIDTAAADGGMTEENMQRALLNELLTSLASQYNRSELEAMLAYLMDSIGEDEFVITRGC